MRSRTVRRAVILAALVALAVTLKLTLFRPVPVPVTVFRAARGRVEETVTNSKAGTVKSRRRASLSTEIGGRVDSLPVRKGDRVREGQVLIELARRDYDAEVRLAERALDAASAGEREACRTALQAATDLDRQTRLAREQIVSKEILDRTTSARDVAEAACEAARARAGQARAALEVARVALSKATLRAPFDGIVADVTTEVGEWITPSPPGIPIPPVLELIDPDAIYVSAPMDEVDVAKVRQGLPARVTTDAYPGRSFAARVTRVAPYVLDVEEQNRTFEVEVELGDAAFARTLLPGTSADVEIVLDARDSVLRVPSYAIIEGSRVLVARDGALASRQVATGLRNWEFVEVLSGLDAGDPVVVSLDRAEVREGARARIAGETEK